MDILAVLYDIIGTGITELIFQAKGHQNKFIASIIEHPICSIVDSLYSFMGNAKHCSPNSYFKNVSGRPISNSSTNNTSCKGGNKSNRNNNRKNNNRSQQSNNNNSNHSNNGFSCNGGCGGGGKDGRDNDENNKKRHNDSNQGQNLDKKDKKNKKEKNEEKKDVKLNVNAPQFVPNCISIPSPLQRKKSPILILDTIDEDGKEENESKAIHPTKFQRTLPIKCAGTIEIPKNLTQNIIPSTIKENISNIYYFMDKSTALRANRKILTNEQFVVINYDFHHKDTDEILYCIVLKQDPAKHRGFSWIMMERLFTKKQILFEFNVSEKELMQILPKSSRLDMKIIQQMDNIHSMHDILQTQLMHGIVERTQWHRIPIYNKANKQQRKVLYLTKSEFMKRVEYFSTNTKYINIIPIMIFNSNKEYWIEHIYIIKIDENIHIGISMTYKQHRNRIEVTGIHLNKQYITDKHQLALPNHDCKCLDYFKSDIDDMKIGNIDQDKNRIKDLQKRHETMKNKNTILKNENDIIKEENANLKENEALYKKKYLKFKKFVKRFSNQKTPISQLLTEAKYHLYNDEDDSTPISFTQPQPLIINTTNMNVPSLSIPITSLYSIPTVSIPSLPSMSTLQRSSSLPSLPLSTISPIPCATAQCLSASSRVVNSFNFPQDDSNQYDQYNNQ